MTRRIFVVVALVAISSLAIPASAIKSAKPYGGSKPDCGDPRPLCAEVQNSKEAFGYYVGHDEPSLLFYSNTPGSGNRAQYQMTVPTEPSGSYATTKSYDFQLHPAFWFGMALCDTQSYPERIRTCTPDSDTNIVDPAHSKSGPGTAFMELQFYPPGWIPQFAGQACDATKWCVALNIDSLSEDPISGKLLNSSCQSKVLGGVEYVNFAFLTLSGNPLGPPNPLQFDPSTSGNPRNADTLFLNQGDKTTVTLHDTPGGFETVVSDITTGQTGRMVASAANGFGQIKWAPKGTSCKMLPYTFHPMYSTSSPQTRVLWAAHSYNVAFSDEIGHFDFCTHIDANTGSCDGQEGPVGDQEVADGDDNFCFASEQALLYPVTGCVDTNGPGFDGMSYQSVWPDGTANHPTPVTFSSPVTGSTFSTPYAQAAFETDLPRIEAPDTGGTCDRTTGVNCVNPPLSDDGSPVAFYPYYSSVTGISGCQWVLGNFPSNGTTNDFGKNAQYGSLLSSTYWAFGGHGAVVNRFNNFRNIQPGNPC